MDSDGGKGPVIVVWMLHGGEADAVDRARKNLVGVAVLDDALGDQVAAEP